MRIRNRSENGFTLLELMITAALIGVLSAIAIPNFLSFQARSRRSEGYTNLASLARAYTGYYAEQDRYPDMLNETGEPTLPDPTPYGGLGSRKMVWDAPTQAFFDIVGWQVEGNVFYSYDVRTPDGGGGCTCTQCFTAAAHGDVDGDGGWGVLIYAHPQTDPSGAVIGECPTGMSVPADPNSGVGGFLFASAYDAPIWHPQMDQY
jgi:type IV pilus assembly protein PilA